MRYSGLVVIRSRSTRSAQIDEQDQPIERCRRLISECRAKAEALGPEDREPVYDLIKYYEQAVDLLLAVVQKNRRQAFDPATSIWSASMPPEAES
jgi:hypothetical protein